MFLLGFLKPKKNKFLTKPNIHTKFYKLLTEYKADNLFDNATKANLY